jgi:hypothetical protein
MCVAFAVPKHREFLRSGTPSEPLLAEAAAWLLNAKNTFQHKAPDYLSKVMECGLLARGERGEMVARLFWTMAHDNVIRSSREIDQVGLSYHQPILLLDWLKEMIDPHWHDHTVSLPQNLLLTLMA